LNDNLPEAQRNQVGWMMSRVNPKDTGRLARAIDAMFEERGAQTLSMSEQAMKIVFLSNFSALLNGVNAICVVLLAVILLILGNGLAMRLRERSHEYGVLAAIGFRRPRIMRLVLGEAAAIGGIGGCLGILLAYLIINRGIGPYLEQNMGSFFPYFRVPWPAACTGFVICLAGATAAAVFPALRAARLNVVDALRKVN
jgi:putative ABC transport system permease protein